MKTRLLTLALLLCGSLAFGAQQTISLGTAPLGSGGDSNRVAFGKVNANFTELYTSVADLVADLAGYQPLDTDLTTFAGITPSANVQSLLSAANYAAIKSLLGLGNVEDTALSTWAGSTNLSTLGTITAGTWQGNVIAPGFLGTGTSITTKYLRGDGTWQTLAAGSGDAMVANPLSQFAATTSLQLAGVLSDESGTGAFVLASVTDALDTRLDAVETDVWEIADPAADSLVYWNDTSNEVETTPLAPLLTHSETFTILEPDATRTVSDDLILKKFPAEKYPNGVTIVAIHIDASAAYTSETFLFEHWDVAAGTTQATVESITATAISTEDDGTLTDATIPADYFLAVNLDDTPEDKAYVSITIVYTVD